MVTRQIAAALLGGFITVAAAVLPARAENAALPSWPAFAANSQAQTLFDEARRRAWTGDDAGAVTAFRAARAADPACALCWWGEAWALGGGIAAPMTYEDHDAALAALAQARRLAPSVGARAVALVDALATRYSPDPTMPRQQLDQAYAEAMQALMHRYKENEIAVLAAAALIALQDGMGWAEDDARHALDAVAILDMVLGTRAQPERMDDEVTHREAANPQHVGALHLYGHEIAVGYLPGRATAR